MNFLKKTFSILIMLSFFLGAFTVSHSVAFAQGIKNTDQAPGIKNTDKCDSRLGCTSSATGFKLGIKLNNPLKVNTIQDAITFFLNTIMKIALPFIVVFFIWSGLSFILARGNPEGIKKAKNMFLYTIIGTLLILGAWAITNAIIGTINTITT